MVFKLIYCVIRAFHIREQAVIVKMSNKFLFTLKAGKIPFANSELNHFFQSTLPALFLAKGRTFREDMCRPHFSEIGRGKASIDGKGKFIAIIVIFLGRCSGVVQLSDFAH